MEVYDGNGNIISDVNNVLKCWEKDFKELYESNDNADNIYRNTIGNQEHGRTKNGRHTIRKYK